MKPIFKVLLSLLLLLVASSAGGYFYFRQKFAAPTNPLSLTGLPATIPFAWRADTTARPVLNHAWLLVPVKLAGCSRTCYLQFDTGAPTSVLYAHPLAALRAQYPATRPMLEPLADSVRNVEFVLGQAQVKASRLRLLDYGAHQLPADTTQPFVVGTLGADVLEGRVLVLDYARQRFSLLARTPDSLAQRAAFAPLEFKSRRVLLSAAMQGTTRQFMFDSGSSAFALLTSQNEWQELAQPAAKDRTTPVNSWGKTLYAHTMPTAATLQFGAATLPLETVTYIEGTNWSQRLLMRFSGMSGMLGNEPFHARTLILDTPGGRFGVVKQ